MPSSKLYRPAGTCILADDLTGACDAAVAFASRGVATQVSLQLDFSGLRCEVLAFSTGTRAAPPEHAAHAIEAHAESLNEFQNVLKKIDSVFRGNTFIEIAAMVRASSGRFAVIAPAAPRHGRTFADGILHVRDIAGSSAVPLRARLSDAGLQPDWLPASSDAAQLELSMRTASRNRVPVFCDGSTEDDLTAVVTAARGIPEPILWIGSSGLAHALAAHLYPKAKSSLPLNPLAGAVVVFSGSNHPVTQRQLVHLQEDGSPVLAFRVERNHTTDDEIRHAVAGASRRTIGCLVLNGGDTAYQVCRALSIRSIRLSGEFAPGVPMGIAEGGTFDGGTLLLKSGGFGEADFLTRLARRSHVHEEQPA